MLCAFPLFACCVDQNQQTRLARLRVPYPASGRPSFESRPPRPAYTPYCYSMLNIIVLCSALLVLCYLTSSVDTMPFRQDVRSQIDALGICYP